MEIIVVVNTDENVAPQYHGYNGSFDNITQCVDCNRTALYEDQHPVGCCPNCGGKIKEGAVGRWSENRKKWLLRKK